MTSLVKKLQNLELSLKSHRSQDVSYAQALREAIISTDGFMEAEVLKRLGDLHLQKGKLNKDLVQFEKAVALYAAALLRCIDPDMRETLDHRIGYVEKLSRQLLQGYSPQPPEDYWGKVDNNVLRVAQICHKLDRGVKNHYEQTYTEKLVTAIGNSDVFLELEVLKSLGDFYLKEGKKTSDISQFSKAHAMYKKALARCRDPETKQTLHHRIFYMEKIKGAAQQLSSRKSHKSGNITRTDVGHKHLHPGIQSKATGTGMVSVPTGNTEEKDTDRLQKEHLKKGESSLARADLDSAERHFAAALKMVHVRDPTPQQYQREVEPLYKLGGVYSKRGQQTGDGGDFVKAAALYNAAIASPDNTKKHKEQLKEMRDQIKLEMENIDQQLNPYIHNDGDPCVKQIEAKRAQAVRQLFEKIAQQRKDFINHLVEECIGLMGAPPCKYAMMGLGSQATALVTPYSDLEFAILVEEESEGCLVFFHNLTHYLHLKVVNLGETILPAVGIKCINDFYSDDPLDDWFYDSVTPRGFAFDGSMPKASKTPLGRQGTMNESPSELICTPENMVSILQKDVTLYLKEGYHLATILRNPCLIAGDQDLIDTYMAITVKILKANGGKMAKQLAQETLKENCEIYSDEETITARLIDVKKELYRFPAVTVDCLALSSSIIPTTVWKTTEDLESQQVISANNAHHLTVLTSISAELRLRTYIANGGQKENLSALASMETALKEQNKDEALNHEQALQVNSSSHGQSTSHPDIAILLNNLGSAWSNLGVHRKAISYFDKALQMERSIYGQSTPHPDIATSLNNLGSAWNDLGDCKKAISYYDQALQMEKSIYGKSVPHPDIARGLINLGSAWHDLGNHRKAISYHEQALQMYKSFFGQSTQHPHIATSLNNLGAAWQDLGDHSKAISCYEQALQMERSIYGNSAPHPNIATSLNNLGSAWDDLGDHRKAISYCERALQMNRSIYGKSTPHPDIARSLNNLGLAWYKLDTHSKAISYHEQALQMKRSIYGQSTPHRDIASSLMDLGLAWSMLVDHRRAISYSERALEMNRSIYGQSTPHSDIAASLNNLGTVWHQLGDHRKAISYHEQALQMNRSIYGQTKPHPDIAESLRNLGRAWGELGDHRKAVSYYEQALQLRRSIYGQSSPHPDIAESLHNLGFVWHQLDDHRKAICYYEQALQMNRSIYGQSTPHPHIARGLINLGSAWNDLGDNVEAISYYEQALQMNRSIYGQSTPHHVIASLLKNLGLAWSMLGDHKRAISYFDQALQMNRSIYGQSTPHPDIAESLHNLGLVWHQLDDHRKAINDYEQALQMNRSIYGQNTPHPHIASGLINLGSAWNDLGDHKEAIRYYEQALQMNRSIYGQSTPHHVIATSLNNLGLAWQDLDDHRKAISYHEQALQMNRSIYGQNTPHPDIAESLHNLGFVWHDLDDHRKAISYYEQALQMRRSIYGQSTPHTNIATSLINLGSAWNDLGDHRKAIRYYEQALQMNRSIYGQSIPHPDIATSLNNMGSAWHQLGDHREAVSYYEQALQLRRRIYGQSTPHPHIATSLNNLGSAWYKLGDHRKAISLCQQALTMAKQLYPQDKRVVDHLGQFLWGRGCVMVLSLGSGGRPTDNCFCRTNRSMAACGNGETHMLSQTY
ncbi:hypothetical protein Bbelb_134710 [Branchiostoma belcheri]|nr:hypothetical protein Bbelb_134710 [Branchiostoma belcheri]